MTKNTGTLGRGEPSALRLLCAGILLLLVAGCGEPPPPPLNVVWIIVDDLGWRDIGAAGSTFYETPSIDRLAVQGARFTRFNTASPVCSPTRASFMTGKHPARLRLTNWIGGEQEGQLLPAEYVRSLPLAEVTPAEVFQRAGYRTGYIGKWHLGAEEFLPDAQGFDVTIAVNGAGQPASYFWPYRGDQPSPRDVPDLEEGGREGEYLSDRLTDEALDFLDGSEPFFLVLSHYAVHTPLQSKDALTSKYEAKAAVLPADPNPFAAESERAVTKLRQDHPTYAGMIESTDDSVGRVLAKLEETGLLDNTVVVLVSDNGGLSTLPTGQTGMPTANTPLRAGKGWLYEGGLRAPLIVRFPDPETGGLTIDVPATSMDLYPTLLELAGLPPIPQQHRDGVSLAPLMRGEPALARDELYWHFPHYHGSGNRPSGAILAGNLKLIEWFEDGAVELYDLGVDPRETTDLSDNEPATVARLRERLGRWRVTVDAIMPAPNPDWRER